MIDLTSFLLFCLCVCVIARVCVWVDYVVRLHVPNFKQSFRNKTKRSALDDI